ncbi:MAG: hypothetical protein MJ178_02710 [Treponemataceae bacterium]|nr:hypothetical protein [Treponemataceae bacterium]
MKKAAAFLSFLIFCLVPLAAHQSKDTVFAYPASFYTLREVYTNDTGTTRQTIDDAFSAAYADACSIPDTGDSLIAQAKCLWMYGGTYYAEGDTAQAENYYDQAMAVIEEASHYTQKAELYVVWAETISQAIMVKSKGFVLTEGLNQQKYAKIAWNMQNDYAPAIWIYNCQYVYMPAPFNNYKRALKEMTRIIEDPSIMKDDWDVYNAGSAIGYVYYAQKKWDKVIEWADFCLSYYPGNKFWITTRQEAVEKLASR